MVVIGKIDRSLSGCASMVGRAKFPSPRARADDSSKIRVSSFLSSPPKGDTVEQCILIGQDSFSNV